MMNSYVDLWDELSKSILTSKEKESTPDTYELHITCRDGKATHAVYKKEWSDRRAYQGSL